MNFSDINAIQNAGFVGFKPIKDLVVNCSELPTNKGVYLILNLSRKTPIYLPVGTGGHFKGKNPNVSIDVLKNNWVDKSLVVYIGKAGSSASKATIKSRLTQYFKFGQGKNIGHWGGRYIWQLALSENLIVCWKVLSKEEPRDVEKQLIKVFFTQYGRFPFANLAA